MRYRSRPQPREGGRSHIFEYRLMWLTVGFLLAGLALIGRFFQLQVLDFNIYHVLAADQHEIQSALIPRRGTIYVKDRGDGALHPIAKDRDVWQIFAAPKEIKDPQSTAKDLADLLHLPEEELHAKLAMSSSSYMVISKDVPLETIIKIRERHLRGIGITKSLSRLFPEEGIGGHVLGFVAKDDENKRVGKYGLEGMYDKTLAGEAGSLMAEKDAAGRRLTIGNWQLKEAKDGADLVLTIDRTIQYTACKKIQAAVREFDADGGTIGIMDTETGAMLALCSTPDFDPQNYGKIKDLAVLNNPATFYQFEPGSIFKAITIAAGLDTGKITPSTTFFDSGEVTIDGHVIKNSDKQGHGVQTMTQLLEKSLNIGAIYVEQLVGRDVFKDYVSRFGFGEKTLIDLLSETRGDISSLSQKGKVFPATASYGQGITVSPLQMVAAYAALGNGGKLLRPYLVQEIRHPDGKVEVTKPQVVRQVISSRTSRLISAMLISVVERGHGNRAGVPGYYVAGKTGTAQIPDPRGGYYEDATIGSFTGFAPANNPRFAMIVKLDHPRTVKFAESSAAPVFGDLAKFLLDYFHIPPERPVTK
ncbi:MAG: penicillin-binding protein 2 [Candidatus Uhrbacteria bacterium]|nr:penicillin-binding protein 2 [Candidatus Uhrbacteria bacterium]